MTQAELDIRLKSALKNYVSLNARAKDLQMKYTEILSQVESEGPSPADSDSDEMEVQLEGSPSPLAMMGPPPSVKGPTPADFGHAEFSDEEDVDLDEEHPINDEEDVELHENAEVPAEDDENVELDEEENEEVPDDEKVQLNEEAEDKDEWDLDEE